MQAKETPFVFLRSTCKYVIPYFQRAYVWNEENWKELLSDLLDGGKNHFLGSIILKNLPVASGSIPCWSVIDGQQRLTTLSILFKAAYDALDKKRYDKETLDEIAANVSFVLFNKENKLGAKKEIKIEHSMLDAPSYRSVIETTPDVTKIVLEGEKQKDNKSSHKILQCYKYFYQELINNSDSAAAVYEFLTNEYNNILVKIDLESDENEQAIFDTVNTAGVRLTCADTIKNVLFQRANEFANTESEKQDVIKLYQDQWESIFLKDDAAIEYWGTERKLGRLKRDNHEVMLQSVALIKGIYDPYKNTISELTNLFREYIHSLDKVKIINFIAEIAQYAQIYREFFTSQDNTTRYSFDNPIARILHILQVMDISTLDPYILKLLKENSIKVGSELPQSLIKELQLLEAYVMRLVACNDTVRVSNLGKVCYLLVNGRTIKEEIIEKEEYIKDELVRSKLLVQKQNKVASIILFWIELSKRKKDKKTQIKELAYSYTIEHIMPQKWEDNWSLKDLPAYVPDSTGISPLFDSNGNPCIENDIELATERRSSAVYEIGNMLLLNGRLNSSISNYEIGRKVAGEKNKKGINYYNELMTTRDFLAMYAKSTTWDEFQIRERSNALTDDFLEIWAIV